MNKRNAIVVGALALVALHFYAKKRGLTMGVAASQILGEMPNPTAGQAQYLNGTQTGSQVSRLTEWGGTFRDTPLYMDNQEYSDY